MTAQNEFPWMAYLNIQFWSKDVATCGGTLISPNSILTAAHCLYGAVSVEVTLGAYDVSSSSSSQQTFNLDPQSFSPHPSFVYGQPENDIAILTLPSNAVLNGNFYYYLLHHIYSVLLNCHSHNCILLDYVQTACLPFATDSDQVNDPVTVTGWGNFSSMGKNETNILIIESIEFET